MKRALWCEVVAALLCIVSIPLDTHADFKDPSVMNDELLLIFTYK